MKYNTKRGAVALEFIISAGILGALGFGLVFMNAGDIKQQQQASANNLRDDQAFIEESKGSEAVMVTDIVLNTDVVHLNVGETFNLTASMQPSNLWNSKLIWEVYKNPSKINTTVSGDTMNLQIKAVENGVSRIKVRSNDGSNVFKTIKVIVGTPVVFSSSQTNLGLVEAGKTVDMAVYAVPEDYSPSKVQITWSVEEGYEYATFNKNVNKLSVTPKSGYVDGTIMVHASAYDVLYEQITEFDFMLNVMDVYTIDYNLDGGLVSSNPTSFTKDTPTFSLNKPTKEGYTFIGWTGTGLSSAQTDVIISKGSIGDRSYTANWRANEYTVHYAGNGNDDGSTASSKHVYDTPKNLTKNGYTRTGYEFVNWNTIANGSGKTYADQESVVNLKSANGDAITLYAQWKILRYKLTYDANTGTLPAGLTNPKELDYQEVYGELPTPTKKGYNLKGWYTERTNGTKVTAATKMGASNTTIYAQWTPQQFTVSYNGNGNTGGSTTSHTATYDSAFSIKANGFTKTGYTFLGWTTKSDGSDDGYNWTGWNGTWVYVNGQYGIANNKLVLYARWKVNSYTATFNANGGSAASPATITKNYGVALGTLPTTSRTGYTLNGWYTAKTGGTKISTTTTMPSNNVTYYAQWSINSYTATFNANGGSTASPATITKTYGSQLGTLPTTSRSGYTFLGWYTAASGGSQISTTTTLTSNVTYYAHWRQWVYTYDCQYWGGWTANGTTKPASATDREISSYNEYQNWGAWSGNKYDASESKVTIEETCSSCNSTTKATGKPKNTSNYTYKWISYGGRMKYHKNGSTSNDSGSLSTERTFTWGYDGDAADKQYTWLFQNNTNCINVQNSSSCITSSGAYWGLKEFGHHLPDSKSWSRYGSTNVYTRAWAVYQQSALNTTWSTSNSSNADISPNVRTQYSYRDKYWEYGKSSCNSGYLQRIEHITK